MNPSVGPASAGRGTAGEVPPVVIHVPHSATTIPEEFRAQFLVDDATLAEIHEAMVDHDTDTMAAGHDAVVVRFGFSRLLVDVERFWDDDAEEMARLGMGALYRVDHELRTIRASLSEPDRAALERRYRAHHAALEAAVAAALDHHERCLLIDLHSYPARRLPYELGGAGRPELCIGTDPFHTPEPMAADVARIAAEHGITSAFNTPFVGTLVPMSAHRRDPRVQSVMLEWRRDVYRDGGESDPAALATIRAVVAEVCRR